MALDGRGQQQLRAARLNTEIAKSAERTEAGRGKAEKNPLCQALRVLLGKQTSGVISRLRGGAEKRSFLHLWTEAGI